MDNIQQVDTLINNAYIVTMDDKRSVYENGFIAIQGHKIVGIGDAVNSNQYKSANTIDAQRKLIIPGMINTHTHHPMSLYRGYANDKPLMDWLFKYILPLEAKTVNREMVRLGSSLSIIEMIKSGVTTFNDMYFFEDEVGKVAEQAGVRAYLGEGTVDAPSPSCETVDNFLKYTEDLYHQWKGHDLVTVGTAVHAPYSTSIETYRKAKDLAEKYDMRFHTHISEAVQAEFPNEETSSIQKLHEYKILDETVTAAHCVHVDEKDQEIMLECGMSVSHNPESNMKLSSGAAPIPKMFDAGINISIGTDGPASNNDLSFFGAMKFTALLHKLVGNDPTLANAKDVFYMATMGGARALGLDKKTGSLEVQKDADLVMIDLNQPHLSPLYDPYAQIVYAMQASDVENLMVRGRWVMKNREVQGLNEADTLDQVRDFVKKLDQEHQISKVA